MKSFLVGCVLLASLTFIAAELSCPKVFDGLTNGHFDLATQFSTSEISANWIELPKEDILGYEWAIVSEEKMNTQAYQGCRSTQGFVGIPDVQGWMNVKKDNHATSSGLTLEAKTTYFVIVRTTLTGGSHVFSMSNGIFILPQELNLEGSHKRSIEPQVNQVEQRNLEDLALECPIDQANRCRKGSISVRDILSELYGAPRFVADPIFAIPNAVDDDDDDDDDDGVGGVLGIIVGAIIGALALLLICCLLLALLGLMFVKGGGEDKFTETVKTTHTEAVDADFGTTTEHAIADDTTVEFPDYDAATRLSVA